MKANMDANEPQSYQQRSWGTEIRNALSERVSKNPVQALLLGMCISKVSYAAYNFFSDGSRLFTLFMLGSALVDRIAFMKLRQFASWSKQIYRQIENNDQHRVNNLVQSAHLRKDE